MCVITIKKIIQIEISKKKKKEEAKWSENNSKQGTYASRNVLLNVVVASFVKLCLSYMFSSWVLAEIRGATLNTKYSLCHLPGAPCTRSAVWTQWQPLLNAMLPKTSWPWAWSRCSHMWQSGNGVLRACAPHSAGLCWHVSTCHTSGIQDALLGAILLCLSPRFHKSHLKTSWMTPGQNWKWNKSNYRNKWSNIKGCVFP